MAIMHDRIKELRNKKGITLAQIADRLDVTEATAQRYETGKGIKTVPYEVIEKYANIFNCTPQYIMGWDEKENKKPADDSELSEAKQELIDFAKSLSEDEAGTMLRMLKAFHEEWKRNQ